MALPGTTRSLTSFKLLSFDIYGTLIDWLSGLDAGLAPLTNRLSASHPLKHDMHARQKAFSAIEVPLLSEQPRLRYDRLLAESYLRLAREWGVESSEEEAVGFGASIGTWAAFPDTVGAIQTLGKYYKLVPLSNVDRASFTKTLDGPLKGCSFDAWYVAEDIGSYKPDHRNFEFLLGHVESEFGVAKDEILHTAVGLESDHGPAKELGLWSAWIARGTREGVRSYEGVGDLEGKLSFQWRWATLGAMAEEVERAFAEQRKE